MCVCKWERKCGGANGGDGGKAKSKNMPVKCSAPKLKTINELVEQSQINWWNERTFILNNFILKVLHSEYCRIFSFFPTKTHSCLHSRHRMSNIAYMSVEIAAAKQAYIPSTKYQSKWCICVEQNFWLMWSGMCVFFALYRKLQVKNKLKTFQLFFARGKKKYQNELGNNTRLFPLSSPHHDMCVKVLH